jgi:hypothetical protein
MKHTIDTLTGKAFYWNVTVRDSNNFIVPAIETDTRSTYLHSTRVPYPLLRDLNPNKPDELVRQVASSASWADDTNNCA